MKFTKYCLLIIGLFFVFPHTTFSMKIGQLARKDFFEDIVGMPENEFRQKFWWKDGVLIKFPDSVWDARSKRHTYPLSIHHEWVKEHLRRAAIFQGGFTFYTIADLDKLIGKRPKRLSDRPQFTILIHDPENKKLTDIRYLQEKNKHAVFQVASTFWGPLEGGMMDYEASLTDMLPHAVQGEEASISAAGATIFRKYFMMEYYYLLEQLKDKLPTKKEKKDERLRYSIDFDKALSYKYYESDIKKVGIGLHRDIVVSSGYGTGSKDQGTQARLDIVVDRQGKVDTTKTQIISQVFTSAYSMISVRSKKLINKNVKDLAQMLLDASYEATVKAAYLALESKRLEQQELFLSLIGGGSFLNDMVWISHALSRPEFVDFIKKTGMHVHLIYRPDKPRAYPVRNVQDDIAFLQKMLTVADDINGTQLTGNQTIQSLIKQYVTAYYGQDTATASQKARALKRALEGGKVVAQKVVSEKKLQYEQYMTLSNGDFIGWIWDKDASEKVLINLRKNKEPIINTKTGQANFLYINPDVPGTMLPKDLILLKNSRKFIQHSFGEPSNKIKYHVTVPLEKMMVKAMAQALKK